MNLGIVLSFLGLALYIVQNSLVKNIAIILIILSMLISCTSKEEKRNEQIKAAITKYTDSMAKLSKGQYHLDSVSVLYIDSVTLHDYLTAVQTANIERSKSLSDWFHAVEDVFNSQISLARLSYSNERDEYMDQANESLAKMSNISEILIAVEVDIDSISKELNTADSVNHYGFLVKSATYVSGLEENLTDTAIYLIDKNNKVSLHKAL